MSNNTIASVHRFGDSVAVFVGTGETVYLTQKQARLLADALLKCAQSVKRSSFTDSAFGIYTITKEVK